MRSEHSLLSRDPLTVQVAGRRITVPYRPAAEWVMAVSRLGSLAGAFLSEQERDDLIDLVMTHPSAGMELEQESLQLLSRATGRKWWESARLMTTSAAPDVLGRMILAGVDPWSRSVGEWVSAVYALCVKGQDEKGRLRFDFMLSIPPPEYEDEWDDDGDDPTVVAEQVHALLGTK
jgi:hypothetical protein